MPALPNIAKRAVALAHSGLTARSTIYSSSPSNYNNARKTISGGIIAAIVIIVVVLLAICLGGCCLYSRKQDRRRQRQAELNKWHKEHPNSATYGHNNSAPPADYAYGAGMNNSTYVSEPAAVHPTPHHGPVDHSAGISSGGNGHSGGHGGTT